MCEVQIIGSNYGVSLIQFNSVIMGGARIWRRGLELELELELEWER